MQGDIVKAAWVLGGCVVLAAGLLAGVVWLVVQNAVGDVEDQLQILTREVSTPIQNLFENPVKVTVEGPLTVVGTYGEASAIPVATELPGGRRD